MADGKRARVVIVGSGPAGLTAAIYAARAALKPLLIEGLSPGGQLTITTDVENYPGFAEPVQGPWLMEQMRAQALHVGVEIVGDHIARVDLSKRPFKLVGDGGQIYLGDALVIATGAQARWLGLPSEKTFQGFGVSACATCDGFFYRGKRVAVVGGGNTAVEEALYLTNFAERVTLIHRRNALRAEKVAQARLFAHPKIDVIWDSVVEEIRGVEEPRGVTHARVRHLKTSRIDDLVLEGVFIAVGHVPATELFRGQLTMARDGYIRIAPWSTATNIKGVFAAGDVADRTYRQAVSAAGMGCMAALEAERFLARSAHRASVSSARKRTALGWFSPSRSSASGDAVA